MSNAKISRGIFLATITLSLNLLSVNVNAQSFLKKIQDAASKAINKKNSAKTSETINQNKSPDTVAAARADNNTADRTRAANPSMPVNAVTTQQQNLGENNFPQNARYVGVSVWGVNYVQQTPYQILNYLRDTSKARGIYSVEEIASGMTFIEYRLSTSLNTNALFKTLNKSFKLGETKLYYIVDTANDQLIKITISDKPLHYVTKETKSNANEQSGSKNEFSGATQVVAPPIDKGNSDDDDALYTKVSLEATFPGGPDIFKIYLKDNLNTNIPKKNGAPAGTYTVVVRFIVAKDGSISDVSATTKVGYGMENEAIRVIAGGPNWEPGQERGKVKSVKYQPITFVVSK